MQTADIVNFIPKVFAIVFSLIIAMLAKMFGLELITSIFASASGGMIGLIIFESMSDYVEQDDNKVVITNYVDSLLEPKSSQTV